MEYKYMNSMNRESCWNSVDADQNKLRWLVTDVQAFRNCNFGTGRQGSDYS